MTLVIHTWLLWVTRDTCDIQYVVTVLYCGAHSRPDVHWQQRCHCVGLRPCQTTALLYAHHCFVLETEEQRFTEPQRLGSRSPPVFTLWLSATPGLHLTTDDNCYMYYWLLLLIRALLNYYMQWGIFTDIRCYMSACKPFFTVTQCCCPRGKSLSLSLRTNLQVLVLVFEP